MRNEERCPSSEELAAFVDGRTAARRWIVRHLSRCARCYEVVVETLRTLAEKAEARSPKRGRILPFPGRRED